MDFIKQYDNIHRNYSKNLNYDEPSNKIFLQGLNFLVKGQKVLDLGCGGGELLVELYFKGAKCTGIDISSEFIKKAKQQFPEIDFQEGDMTDLPFSNNSFDVILSKYALQSVENLQQVWDEVARVLKPGGIFYYLTKHPVRQFIEKTKNGCKDYYKQVVVESRIFNGSIILHEPSHTLGEYLSSSFLKNFRLLEFHEASDFPASEQINGLIYPTFFIIKAERL